MAESTSGGGGDGGDSDMGYYVDSFLVPLLNSVCESKQQKKILKEKLRILVPACVTLPLHLYERGFKNITIVDSDKALMIRMMREHLRDRPEMRWRTVEITSMTQPVAVSSSKTETKVLIERDYFHVVIDHAALDTLLSSTSDLFCYLEEVRNVLKEGGKFICNTILKTEARDQIFQVFRYGHKTSLCRLHQNERAFLILVDSVSSRAPFLMSSKLDDIEDMDHLHAIEKENRKRSDFLDDMVFWIEDLREGVMGDMKSIIPGRHMELFWPGSRFAYDISVFDVDIANSKYSYDANFFREEVVTKTEIIMLSWLDNDRRLLKSVAQASRLYLIFVGDDAQGFARKKILDDLQPLLQELAPRDSTLPPRSYWFSTRDLTDLLEEKDKEVKSTNIEGLKDTIGLEHDTKPELVDLVPSYEPSSSRSPSPQALPSPQTLPIHLASEGFLLSSRGTQFSIHSGHSNEKHVLNINMDKMGTFHIETINTREKSVLIEVKYDMTLTEWLKQTPNRWSVKHENWNSDASRKINKVDKVKNWNSSRPTEECCQVIEGLLKEVCEWHSRKRVHGYLSKSDNYGLSFRSKSVFGVERKFVDVTLLYVDTTDEVVMYEKSYETDMMCLASVIFVSVLGNKKLPRLWDHLHKLIMQLANEVHLKKLNQQQLASARDKIEGHLALWKWRRRWELYEMLWIKFHGSVQSQVRAKVTEVVNSIPSLANWDFIPKDTPLHRVLGTGYNLDSYGQFHYLRSLHMHYKDKQYGILKYVKTDETDYLDDEYMEVVSTEVFSKFQLGIFKEMEGKLQEE